MDYISEIRNIIKKYVDEGEFEDETTLQALGIDSLEYVQMIVEAEDMFDIEIDDDALILEDVSTVGAFIRVIVNSVKKVDSSKS